MTNHERMRPHPPEIKMSLTGVADSDTSRSWIVLFLGPMLQSFSDSLFEEETFPDATDARFIRETEIFMQRMEQSLDVHEELRKNSPPYAGESIYLVPNHTQHPSRERTSQDILLAASDELCILAEALAHAKAGKAERKNLVSAAKCLFNTFETSFGITRNKTS